MQKKLLSPALLMTLCAFIIISCKKSDNLAGAGSPKRLVEIWQHKGQPDQWGIKLQYDEQGRIIKRTLATDPSTYETWTYSGSGIINHKIYNSGRLDYNLTNSYSSITGLIMETTTMSDSSGKLLNTAHYVFDTSGHAITQSSINVEVNPSPKIEQGFLFRYTGEDLSTITDRHVQDGVVSFYPNTVTVKTVDTHPNPFYDMGLLNQTLTSFGDHWLSKGRHNITSLEGIDMGAYPFAGTYTWTYDADGYPVSLRTLNSAVDVVTYVYSR